MKVVEFINLNSFRRSVFLVCGLLTATLSNAGLFEDDEARKAILDLRQRVEGVRAEVDLSRRAATDDNAAMGKSLLELQRQIEFLKADVASLRGANEQLMREMSEIQRIQKDHVRSVNERLGKLEPIAVTVDGVEFFADPGETRAFEAAMTSFKKSDFVTAETLFAGFIARFPSSSYVSSALFWLGNAQYASRAYKEAIVNFRALIARDPEHIRVPEAVLSVANCQLELKDTKGARKTLTDLLRAYPQSEAAVVANERLSSLK